MLCPQSNQQICCVLVVVSVLPSLSPQVDSPPCRRVRKRTPTLAIAIPLSLSFQFFVCLPNVSSDSPFRICPLIALFTTLCRFLLACISSFLYLWCHTHPDSLLLSLLTHSWLEEVRYVALLPRPLIVFPACLLDRSNRTRNVYSSLFSSPCPLIRPLHSLAR